MFNKIKTYLQNIDTLTYKIIKIGLYFCLILAILSAILLLIYSIALTSQNIYYIGLSLFKLSCSFGVEFIVCGFAMDALKKQLL